MAYWGVEDSIHPTAWGEKLGIELAGARTQLALAEKTWENAEASATQMISRIEGTLHHLPSCDLNLCIA